MATKPKPKPLIRQPEWRAIEPCEAWLTHYAQDHVCGVCGAYPTDTRATWVASILTAPVRLWRIDCLCPKCWAQQK